MKNLNKIVIMFLTILVAGCLLTACTSTNSTKNNDYTLPDLTSKTVENYE